MSEGIINTPFTSKGTPSSDLEKLLQELSETTIDVSFDSGGKQLIDRAYIEMAISKFGQKTQDATVLNKWIDIDTKLDKALKQFKYDLTLLLSSKSGIEQTQAVAEAESPSPTDSPSMPSPASPRLPTQEASKRKLEASVSRIANFIKKDPKAAYLSAEDWKVKIGSVQADNTLANLPYNQAVEALKAQGIDITLPQWKFLNQAVKIGASEQDAGADEFKVTNNDYETRARNNLGSNARPNQPQLPVNKQRESILKLSEVAIDAFVKAYRLNKREVFSPSFVGRLTSKTGQSLSYDEAASTLFNDYNIDIYDPKNKLLSNIIKRATAPAEKKGNKPFIKDTKKATI